MPTYDLSEPELRKVTDYIQALSQYVSGKMRSLDKEGDYKAQVALREKHEAVYPLLVKGNIQPEMVLGRANQDPELYHAPRFSGCVGNAQSVLKESRDAPYTTKALKMTLDFFSREVQECETMELNWDHLYKAVKEEADVQWKLHYEKENQVVSRYGENLYEIGIRMNRKLKNPWLIHKDAAVEEAEKLLVAALTIEQMPLSQKAQADFERWMQVERGDPKVKCLASDEALEQLDKALIDVYCRQKMIDSTDGGTFATRAMNDMLRTYLKEHGAKLSPAMEDLPEFKAIGGIRR